MQVESAGDTGLRGGHERSGHGGPAGQRAHGVLEDDVVVAGGQRRSVGEGDLYLTGSTFRLDGLHGHTSFGQRALQAPEEPVVLRGMVERVVQVVDGHRHEPVQADSACRGVDATVEHELGLQAGLGMQTMPGEACQLVPQDLSGSDLDGLFARAEGMAEDKGCARHPGQDPQRRQIRLNLQVLVPARPGGEGESVDRGHVGVRGQDVGAHLRAAVEHAVEEVPRPVPLALETPLQVRHGKEHCVDQAGTNGLAQLLDTEHAGRMIRRGRRGLGLRAGVAA